MPTALPATAPAALRRLPAPASEPPYDDEPSAAGWGQARPRGQTMLALTFPLPSGLPAMPHPPALRVVVDADEEFGRRPTGRGELPDPDTWAARLVQALVEVLGGERPAGQLVRWTNEEVYARVRRAAALPQRAATSRARAHVRSVHVCEPDDGVAEVAAVVVRAGRAQALALRLEGLDGRWQCTTLDILMPGSAYGEDEALAAG